MRRYIMILAAMACGILQSYSQDEITGCVMGRAGEETVPLSGATVYLAGQTSGALTGPDGTFAMELESRTGYLVASFMGYTADSVDVASIVGDRVEFVLEPNTLDAGEVVVTGSRQGSTLSRLTPQKTEMITSTGLLKMACCTLAESFENSATVTVGFTDAVSGAKQVQLLGLAGIYSQMMAENIPTMRGLASTFGWSYTPGTWLEAINISKGASSVVNGYESVSGQMNLEFKKPDNTEQLFINLFADDDQMYEANVTASARLSDRLWTGLMLSGSMSDKKHDHDGDGFMDMPRTKLINLYNRWNYYARNGVESRTGIKFLYEDRISGQVRANECQQLYRTDIANRNITVENKTGFAVGNKEGQSIGIIAAFTNHRQNSGFGFKEFDGTQNSLYTNVLFNSFIGSAGHAYTAGASFTFDHYDMTFADRSELTPTALTDLGRREAVPGAFAQYTYTSGHNFTLMVGARGDYNSRFGWLFTPRANVRYNFLGGKIVARASVGRGFRSPNVIAENIGLLASSRRFNVETIASLDIERAWNMGGNVSFYIPAWGGREIVLSLDYFHTDFQNQAVVDMERDAGQVYFYNLDGRSYADVWQADLSLTLFEGMDLFAAFRYNDTRVTYADNGTRYRVEKPLMSRYRGLVNLSYATRFKKWVFDVTLQVNGPSRLPSLEGYGAAAEHSPSYPVWFAQATKNTKRFDIYVGVENAFDFRQHHAILGADDPFGPGFDSARVWGPLMGRRIYAGIRLRIGKF